MSNADRPGKTLAVRAAAAQILFQVVDQGQSLSQMLARYQARVEMREFALLQELCYGVLRWLPRFEHCIQERMEKPLKGKIRCLHFLLMVGLYQLYFMRIPAHAAVSETVQACHSLGYANLKKLLNGVLRSIEREYPDLEFESGPQALIDCHPSWIRKRLQATYPDTWKNIVDANNQRAPMWLRVNSNKSSVADYKKQLTELEIDSYTHPFAIDALRLEKPCGVGSLPEFELGVSSVQDAAAQFAAHILDAQAGDAVLDACAAPGGKTCHIMERQGQLKSMLAIDVDAQRLERVQQNLDRIGLDAKLMAVDAASADAFSDMCFDRILLDAPCSATGVIRRHPDIKWLRRESDIAALVALQAKILDNLWHFLRPGGTLVYATCSILPDENSQQVEAFLARQSDASLEAIEYQSDPSSIGWQLLPGVEHSDGFYYAKLVKAKA
ncbi:16S rRNA (cytosine(967)-C(5))-methyltransferase RsmB [Alginatibacterium sediminis]|uniref:16S rRNA (cytosine(967)-C(5))-methyltransferase n=1 Tax=Alginatibacterium sediminis TaxID=2164068 RepID=A0A420ENF7_9ALTE|nr:16S rRNA (cytosine(967)-C(5))-methyltransferase RsmB [Alginatibacterium sediminis]RKF22193.1 16S rRNA (cytosine(967)-C(5))-methyltransferase RsmB [Alginatibacterium sediminis]